MLLHIAQWDVCCDGDDNAAAAQSEAQAQLLFQGLGSCLGFMNEERLSFPRVRPAITFRNLFVQKCHDAEFRLICLSRFSSLPDSSVCCVSSSIATQVPRPNIFRV